MTVEEIRSSVAEVEALRLHCGALSLRAYIHQPTFGPPETIFVADLDASHPEGYADRYFELMFGLQRTFAQQIDLVESQMFVEAAKRYGPLEPVSLEVLRATA